MPWVGRTGRLPRAGGGGPGSRRGRREETAQRALAVCREEGGSILSLPCLAGRADQDPSKGLLLVPGVQTPDGQHGAPQNPSQRAAGSGAGGEQPGGGVRAVPQCGSPGEGTKDKAARAAGGAGSERHQGDQGVRLNERSAGNVGFSTDRCQEGGRGRKAAGGCESQKGTHPGQAAPVV